MERRRTWLPQSGCGAFNTIQSELEGRGGSVFETTLYQCYTERSRSALASNSSTRTAVDLESAFERHHGHRVLCETKPILPVAGSKKHMERRSCERSA